MEPTAEEVRSELNGAGRSDGHCTHPVIEAGRRAIAKAMREHKERGQYVVGWEDGRVVVVAPDDIVVSDVD